MTRTTDRIVIEITDRSMTIPQIAEAVGMTKSAVDKACWRLKRLGLVVVVGKRQTNGRPFDLYQAARTQKAA